MSDVNKNNELKRLEEAKRQARLAQAAHHIFRETPDGKELYAELRRQSGANHSAFKHGEGWNPHGAAYRDGMRATFLILENLIETYIQDKRNDE